MDAFNKAVAQIGDLFKSLTPGGRITAGLLLGVLIVGLALLFRQQVSGPDDYLLGGQAFSSGEINAMEAAFGQANLGGYVMEGARVRIPTGQKAAYLAALADANAMPAGFGDYLKDVVMGSGPWVSSFQMTESIKVAKQQELTQIIRKMQGIETASVMYESQRKTGLSRNQHDVTGSVSVTGVGGMPLAADRLVVIRHLVASAIGAPAESVTVIDTTNGGGMLSGSASSGSGSGFGAMDDQYLSRMRAYQKDYEDMVRRALPYVPGVMVSANIELDKEKSRFEEQVSVDPTKTTPLRAMQDSTSSKTESAAPQGRVGLEAQQQQGANTAARVAASATGPKTDEKITSREEENAVSHGTTRIERSGLTPQKVAIAVSVPTSYFASIWREENPTPEGQQPKQPEKAELEAIQQREIAKIRDQVLGLQLPTTDGVGDANKTVQVTAFTNVMPDNAPESTVVSDGMTWLAGNWNTVGMIVLVLFSLMMLRSIARSAPPPVADAIGPITLPIRSDTADRPEGEKTAAATGPRLKRKVGQGTSLRDELAEIVKEDPDAAANILRGWIGNAS